MSQYGSVKDGNCYMHYAQGIGSSIPQSAATCCMWAKLRSYHGTAEYYRKPGAHRFSVASAPQYYPVASNVIHVQTLTNVSIRIETFKNRLWLLWSIIFVWSTGKGALPVD